MVVVAEASAADLIDVLGKAGAFPIVETRWADAPATIAEIQPVALAIADPHGTPSPQHVHATIHGIETRGGPVMPVIALVDATHRSRHSWRAGDRDGRLHRSADRAAALGAADPQPACHGVASGTNRGREKDGAQPSPA